MDRDLVARRVRDSARRMRRHRSRFEEMRQREIGRERRERWNLQVRKWSLRAWYTLGAGALLFLAWYGWYITEMWRLTR
jgi:hypothetical protein